MAQPQAYNRETDFTERDGDDTNHPGINIELDAAAQSINEIRDNLALIQRDDGALQNGIVTAESLAPTAFDAFKGDLNEAVADAQTAATSANNAAVSANTARDTAVAAKDTAVTSANAAALNATTATTKAAESSASATASQTSATASANSATASQTSRLASEAARDAAQAAQAAASASQTATATSEANASASAATATAQAGIATTQAGIATTQAASASASATAAAASLEDFDDRYLGSKTADPTTDNDGNALITGALYFNSVAGEMRVWAGTFWKATGSSVGGTINTAKYTATAGQTTFAIVYDVGFVHVYLNGVKLESGVEFTANNGTSVILSTGATAGDVVDMIAFGIFSVANTYTKAEADALLGAKANQATTYTKTEVDTADALKLNAANPSYTGTLTGGTGVVNLGSGQFYKDASGNVGVGTATPAGAGLTLGNGKDFWLEATGYSAWKQTNYQGAYYWRNGADRLILTSTGHLGLGTAVTPPSGVNKFIAIGDADSGIGQVSDGVIAVYSNGVKRLQVDATGATQSLQKFQILTQVTNNGDFGNRTLYLEDNGAGTNAPAIGFHAPNNGQAGILKFWGGSGEFEFRNSTDTVFTSCRASAFNISSDYRLKEDIQPMGGALQRVINLKPVTYKWKDGGKSGQGFIAHELAEVFPDAVTGEKDGVDAFNNPVYQGIDTSFLVATLVAAIQEQQSMIEQLKADVAALKAAA